ncbi:MAG: type IV pilin protein [Myxococcota bacterium]
MSSRRGFSLVELMIVVAIIGILAALAIPNFRAMQYKAKRAEVPGNVTGIHTSELAYEASFDEYVSATANPSTTPGKDLRDFDLSISGWRELGWSPDGPVRGQYAVSAASTDFTVIASTDIDGDGDFCVYTATRSTNARLASGDENVY